MIEEIVIRDLGVIATATLPLSRGFSALTGETGAGKTMVVQALGLLLGDRADSGAVRRHAETAWVEGHWLVSAASSAADRVRDAGGDLDDAGGGESALVLGRSVSVQGRSRAVVGGRSAPVSVLADVGSRLVVVHGQSEQFRLTSRAAQRDALDRFGGEGVASALRSYREVYDRWRGDRAELEALTADRERRAREAADLSRALAEIEAVAPQAGEDDRLAATSDRLTNREDLRLAAAGAREALSAELPDSADATTLVDTARRLLDRVAGIDPALARLAETVGTLSFQVADVAAELSSYLASLDEDGARELDAVQARRHELAQLVRKHGPTLDHVLAVATTGSVRLAELEGDDDRITALAAGVADDDRALKAGAEELRAARAAAGGRLEGLVSTELSALAMPDARFVVQVTPGNEPTVHGQDDVEMLLSPHVGASPRPLARGASGGELSRIMLSLEVVLAATDPVPTIVFDEIDAGVGGAAAIEIGRRLARLAETTQVIVVTHLAQVAAFATNHLAVVKDQDGSVTASDVRRLVGDERVAEMARLLSGLPDSVSGLAHARELLDLAQEAPVVPR